DDDDTSFEKSFNHAVDIVKGQGREIVGLLGNVSSTSTLTYGKFCSRNYKPMANNFSINQNVDGNVNNNQIVTGNANNNQNANSNTGKNTEAENDGIPMFLPLATATSLIKNLDLKNVPAVLRLPPANDKQAENISSFLLKGGVFKTVILKDLTNETYSTDLIENFRENYVQKHLSGGTPDFGEIVGTIPIGGKETSPFLYSALSGEGTGLVIAGMTNSAIETLAQAKASNSNFNAIILTDGAVDEYLGKRIKKIRNEDDLKNLYLSFPSPCSLDKALEKYIGDEPTLKPDDFKFTHALFVADGVYIIISELNDKIVQDRNKTGNKILIDFINGLKEKAEKSENDWKDKNPDKPENPASKSVSIGTKLPFTEISKRDYLIDKFGNNTNAGYFLFKLDSNSNWKPVDDNQSAKNCSDSK
ncbi:MAG TPA: hypothetical protein VNB22_17290, partial [Pyrinomonadaceae bacterium]|nr:hypothetical protein [Pyrinomonadaceae bacterium]